MIIFAWDGFPQYAARCVGALVKVTDEKVMVVATRPKVPIEGMERLCGCEVQWVDANQIAIPKTCDEETVLFVSGWFVPAFNALADHVRAVGGRVICMLDNNYRFSFRELVKAVRFRLKLRRRFGGFFVPGRSGRKLLRFYGVPDKKIADGLYAADETLFCDGAPLSERAKKIVYVGQFIERKNVRRLCEAFIHAEGAEGWSLELYGSGPLRDELVQIGERAKGRKILIHDFLQPEALAEKYREARIFCLPSMEEHWGLVVHEAALSGCVLCLSNEVGAAADLAGNENGLVFDPTSEFSVAGALNRAMALTDEELGRAQRGSLELSKNAGLKKFVEGVEGLVAGC